MNPPIHLGRKTLLRLFSALALATGIFAGSFAVVAAAAINPNAPVLTTTTLPDANVGAAYSQSIPISGGTGPYTATCAMTGTSTGLAVTPTASAPSTDVAIAGTPTAGTSTVTCTVTDTSTGLTSTSVIPITVDPAVVVPATPTLMPTTLPSATVGTVYNQTLAIAGGSGAPYTVDCSGPQPAGLTVTPDVSTVATNVTVSGTPTTAGPATVTCSVTGVSGPASVNAIPITVNPTGFVPTAPTIPSATLPDATVGSLYTTQTLPITGGTGPDATTCAITPLTGTTPDGLVVTPSATNVVISGTPTAAGAATVDCTVTDSTGLTSNSVTPITVDPAAIPATPVLPTATLPSATVGTPYATQTLPITGGTGPYTAACAITGATGLVVTPTTSAVSTDVVISGTPTAAGPATVTCTVTDSTSATSTSVMPITVNPTGFVPVAPTLPATALPTGTVGTPYNVTLPVTGGTAPGPYAIACSGTPPAGLTVTPSTTSLGSNVVISGTPTIAGVTADAVNCTVTDSTGLTSTSILPLTIDVPQVIIPTPPGAPVVVAVATPAVTPASAVTATTATLNGTIDPSGTAITSEEFCYIQGSTLVDCQGAMIDPIVPLTLPAGTTTTALSGVVSGLIANSPYCYQLETTNAVSTYYSAPECFTTLATNASTPVTPAVILPSSLRYITHFAENRSTLTASDKVTIHALAAFIVAHKDLHDALIGYTDPLYTKAYNLALGERRAMSVAVQLKKDLAAMGVSNVSTKAASGGATDYVVVGLSNSARAKDRRVTVSVN